MPHSPLQEKLYEQACHAMNRAYNPYSKYGVGVALHTVTGDIFVGCNVENVSYGLTLCGERNAITSMVAALGHTLIDELLLVVSGEGFPSPCGACRQVMAEFSTPETKIHLARRKENGSGFEVRTYRMAALLPLSFTQQVMFGAQASEVATASPLAQKSDTKKSEKNA